MVVVDVDRNGGLGAAKSATWGTAPETAAVEKPSEEAPLDSEPQFQFTGNFTSHAWLNVSDPLGFTRTALVLGVQRALLYVRLLYVRLFGVTCMAQVSPARLKCRLEPCTV